MLLIAAYNLGDVIGKLGPLIALLRSTTVLILSISRAVFIPVFYFAAANAAPSLVCPTTAMMHPTKCCAQSPACQKSMPPSPWHTNNTPLPCGTLQVICILTLLLGATNGYLTACAMMMAPRGLQKNQAEVAGMLSALFLVFGIVLGSCSGLLWQL